MSVKLLTEHHLEFLSLKGGCTGSSESTLFKMPHCWKSHIEAHFASEKTVDSKADELNHVFNTLNVFRKTTFNDAPDTKAI